MTLDQHFPGLRASTPPVFSLACKIFRMAKQRIGSGQVGDIKQSWTEHFHERALQLQKRSRT
jgi:hypothetical protein